MAKYLIEGGVPIGGELSMHGAKNAALPILAASLVPCTKSVISNCPRLSDVDAALSILRCLGCEVTMENGSVAVEPSGKHGVDIPDSLMGEMRSSILFLGAVITRFGRARLSYPGGCELGPRPIDMHISALRKMGAIIDEDHGYLDCRVDGRLVGCEISLPFPSVGATENVLIAASVAEGTTVLHNAAREPEIVDLAGYLNACGARVSIHSDSTIIIEGVEALTGAAYGVIPDRIATATYLCAAAATGGELLLRDVCPGHLAAVLPVFEEMGCHIDTTTDTIALKAPRRLKKAAHIITMPYPGFPTDAQAPFMAMASLADGNSIFVENIFESRYKQAGELVKMGAKIRLEGRVAVVEGVPSLHSASVRCTDLRGGAALVVAALAAEGTTLIQDVRHIDRGYEHLMENLSRLGARIIRE